MPVFDKRLDSPEFLASLLKQVALFAPLHPGELEQLAAACIVRHFAGGTTLVAEDAPGSSMFVLIQGLRHDAGRS